MNIMCLVHKLLKFLESGDRECSRKWTQANPVGFKTAELQICLQREILCLHILKKTTKK